ncbi:MAG: zinc ribbon domain-containing protein, partial [Acidimicrobiales bacterium]
LGAAEDEREKQIAAITSRIEAIESRLRSGSSGSFRDQQAMGEEVASLEGQKRRAEDAEIEVMEQLEPVIAELAELVRDVARLDEEIAAARAALSAAEAGIDEESSRLRASRQGVAAGIDDALRRDYEALRAKLGGIGAARVVEGSCSGCHLKLPASERDRISHASPGSIAHCEQCGRILVP